MSETDDPARQSRKVTWPATVTDVVPSHWLIGLSLGHPQHAVHLPLVPRRHHSFARKGLPRPRHFRSFLGANRATDQAVDGADLVKASCSARGTFGDSRSVENVGLRDCHCGKVNGLFLGYILLTRASIKDHSLMKLARLGKYLP